MRRSRSAIRDSVECRLLSYMVGDRDPVIRDLYATLSEAIAHDLTKGGIVAARLILRCFPYIDGQTLLKRIGRRYPTSQAVCALRTLCGRMDGKLGTKYVNVGKRGAEDLEKVGVTRTQYHNVRHALTQCFKAVDVGQCDLEAINAHIDTLKQDPTYLTWSHILNVIQCGQKLKDAETSRRLIRQDLVRELHKIAIGDVDCNERITWSARMVWVDSVDPIVASAAGIVHRDPLSFFTIKKPILDQINKDQLLNNGLIDTRGGRGGRGSRARRKARRQAQRDQA